MMNKDEAVQKLATAGRLSIAHAEDLYDSFLPKPVVPPYVADWYWANKDGLEFNLIDWINKLHLGIDGEEFTEFDEWLLDTDNNPIQTLVDMHRLGYEVENEPRYTVRFKGLSNTNIYLKANLFRNFWDIEEDDFGSMDTCHTRKELESNGFGWVFSCEGVEVKEVTDE